MWHEWEIRSILALTEKKPNGTVISMPKPKLEDNIEMELKNIRGNNSCLKMAPG